MDDGRIIGMKEDHAFGYLLGNVNAGVPRQFIIRLVKQIEEGGTSAILIDDIEVLIVLADSDERD